LRFADLRRSWQLFLAFDGSILPAPSVCFGGCSCGIFGKREKEMAAWKT